MHVLRALVTLTAAGLLSGGLTACSDSGQESATSSPSSSQSQPSGSSTSSGSSTTSSPSQSSTSTSPATPSQQGSGSADSAAFCQTLVDSQRKLQGLNSSSMTQETFSQLVDEMSKIADAAPQQVKAEATSAATVLSDTEKLLSKYDLTFEDLSTMQKGQLPQGVTQQQMQKLAQEAASIDFAGMQGDLQTLTQYSQQECGASNG